MFERLRRNNDDQRSRFTETSAKVSELVATYQAGRLSSRRLAEQLADLITVDDYGAEWTVGAVTGRWYRRVSNGPWEAAEPPTANQSIDVPLPAPEKPGRRRRDDVVLVAPDIHTGKGAAAMPSATAIRAGDHDMQSAWSLDGGWAGPPPDFSTGDIVDDPDDVRDLG